MDLIFGFFGFLFGAIVGSFLNSVIFRLDKEKSALRGRSYCPHCKHQLSWLDLIPLVSFLLLEGKCRYCYKSISWQYPLVELATALLFFCIVLQQPAFTFAATLETGFLFFVASAFIVIFVYDLYYFIIPDIILFPALGVAFAYRFAIAAFFRQEFMPYLLASLVASGFFLLLFLVSRGAWIGFGDVKLALLLGLVLGSPNILVGLFLAFLFGAIIGVGLIAFRTRGLKSEVPFAPFLILGTWLALFFGDSLLEWYLRVFLFQ